MKDRLTVLTEQLETLEASVEQLNTSLDLLAGEEELIFIFLPTCIIILHN